MARLSGKVGDFDPDALAISVDQHAKDIAGLDQRITALEQKFGTPVLIAETLHETASVAVKMKDMLEANFIALIFKNEPIRNEIKSLIKAADRDFLQSKLKQYRTWIGAGLLFLLAQISTELVKWLIGLLHKN